MSHEKREYKHMKKLTFLLFVLCLIACENEDGTQARLRINHYQQPITRLADHFVFVTQDKNQFGSNQWSYSDPNIEGFEYDWGYTYELVVKKEELKNPPQDASSIKTTLIKVVSKERVTPATPFEIRLTMAYDDGGFSSYMHGDLSSGGYTLLGQVAVNCGNLCDDLSQGLNARESLVGTFNHLEEGIKLIELKRE